MECPICFFNYDAFNHLPIKTFCKCNNTLCLACIENMVKNSAFCPWDKTRWSGRNLMSKFYDATPDKYIDKLQKEHENISDKNTIYVPKVVKLGSGELRNEYLKQQQLENERFQHLHAAQLEKDKELALQLSTENKEIADKLSRIEEEDRIYAETLAKSRSHVTETKLGSARVVPPKNKSLIALSLEKQRSLSSTNSNTDNTLKLRPLTDTRRPSHSISANGNSKNHKPSDVYSQLITASARKLPPVVSSSSSSQQPSPTTDSSSPSQSTINSVESPPTRTAEHLDIIQQLHTIKRKLSGKTMVIYCDSTSETDWEEEDIGSNNNTTYNVKSDTKRRRETDNQCEKDWQCSTCTFQNNRYLQQCEVCDTPRKCECK